MHSNLRTKLIHFPYHKLYGQCNSFKRQRSIFSNVLTQLRGFQVSLREKKVKKFTILNLKSLCYVRILIHRTRLIKARPANVNGLSPSCWSESSKIEKIVCENDSEKRFPWLQNVFHRKDLAKASKIQKGAESRPCSPTSWVTREKRFH